MLNKTVNICKLCLVYEGVLCGRVVYGADLRLNISCRSPLRSLVRASLAPKTLCEKVSSYLRTDGGSTQSELL